MRGLGFSGVVMDEFGQMDEATWMSVVRPALADHAGFAVFIGTFAGKDALYRLIESTRGLPDWACYVVKASESGVLPPEELEAARLVMPPDVYAREMECDPSAAPPGSIFGALVSQMRQAGPIIPIPFVRRGHRRGRSSPTPRLHRQRPRHLPRRCARELSPGSASGRWLRCASPRPMVTLRRRAPLTGTRRE